MKKHPSGVKPESWLVSAGRASEPGAPLNVPLIPASNFLLGKDRSYSRDDGTPTWEALEDVVGGLESGRAVAFASGMAAIASVFDQLSAGAVVVLPDDCYQGVVGLAEAGARKQQWAVQRVALDDTAGWIRSCEVADLIWLESPSNPLLAVADLEAVCAAPRKPGAIVAVDNTFATPLNQQPLELGASVSCSRRPSSSAAIPTSWPGSPRRETKPSGTPSRHLVSCPARHREPSRPFSPSAARGPSRSACNGPSNRP